MNEFSCVQCGSVSKKQPRRVLRFMRQASTIAVIDHNTVDAVHMQLSSAGIALAKSAAQELAESNAGKKIRMIITSPLPGAFTTASIFASRLHVPIIRADKLSERDMGSDFRDKLNESYFENLMRRDYNPPGLSPLEEFEKETAMFLADCAISQRLGTDTLFVTHVLRIMTLMKIIKGWEPKKMADWRPPDNCGILTFAIGTSCNKCKGLMYEAV